MINISSLDIFVVLIFLFVTFGISLYYRKKNSTLREYFQSEGSLSWFVAGTGMVATTFAADTPLAVTELVAESGVSGNWVWWAMAIGSVVTTYFFAPLWKRSGALTDIELIRLRYSGKAAHYLRSIKAVYFGFFINILVMSWVNLAIFKILKTLAPELNSELVVSCLFFFAFLYTAIVGLTGISYLDTFQFFFAMTGCVVLAFFAVNLPEIGGVRGILEKIPNTKIQLVPDFFSGGKGSLNLETFLILVCVVWWSSWYPGAEPGGGGYIAQRIMATKNVRESIYSSLYFTIAHYFIRPWPWILVALVSVVLYPDLPLEEKGQGFILVMKKALPSGFFGLLIASFIAAYLSTIATHLNWGASYLVNDVYKPYVRRSESDSHYIKVSVFLQLLCVIFALPITFYGLQTVSGVWIFLIECAAGIGFVLMARWYWQKINVYSEISAFVASPIFYSIGKYLFQIQFPYSVLFTSCSTLFVVVAVAFLSPKTETSVLANFYRTVKPPGYFWKNWAVENNFELNQNTASIFQLFVLTLSGVCLVFSGLFGIGYWIFGNYLNFFVSCLVFFLSLILTVKLFPKES